MAKPMGIEFDLDLVDPVFHARQLQNTARSRDPGFFDRIENALGRQVEEALSAVASPGSAGRGATLVACFLVGDDVLRISRR